MRHHVSTNQLVLWPRHEISEAWAPSGIMHPSQAGDCPRDAAQDSDSVTGGPEGIKPVTGGVTTALARVHGRRHRGSSTRVRTRARARARGQALGTDGRR